MELSHTQAGANLTSCELDETCAVLDCDAVMSEFGSALLGSEEGEAFLAHYCGLDFIGKPAESAVETTVDSSAGLKGSLESGK